MSEGVIRAFSQFLGSLNYGATHEEMTKQMNTLIAEMSTTRCDQGGGVVKGELTLKLTFKLDDIMEVTPEIKVKNPKNVEGKAVFSYSIYRLANILENAVADCESVVSKACELPMVRVS